MKLYDIIKKCDSDVKNYNEKITKEDMQDIRPESPYKIRLCFMCEEETWITVYPTHPILIPFYNVECSNFSPGKDYILNVWIDDNSFVKEINKIIESWEQK